ncbi:hypothetical protein B0T16DRAFT_450372 [Cercophora newfieldiana]|uniref:FAD-binding domain-containing protein n=1 Tax=Cercophora newfieldiana TaxID=92897 RepID=A0AA40CJF2_9PEZI|nr:hypothetical protein B0T16DRAFT_450372 [Cercophora newfieldiana]
MSNLRVLVVGASIAGPTAAYWFAKAGAKVTVIERFPNLRTNGQNIDIRTVGVTVMRRMTGMEDAVRSKLVPIEGLRLVNSKGHPYGTLKATGDPDQQSLLSEYEIFRGELAKILYDMTKDDKNIQYVFGEQIKAIHQDPNISGPVTVDFTNGFPSAHFDLVVACDGATSRTRALGFGCGVRDHFLPVNAWAAYFTIEKDLLDGSRMGHGYSAVGGRFVALGSDANGGSRVVLMGIYPRFPSSNTSDDMPSFREAAASGDDAIKRFLASRFSSAGWKCDDIVKGLASASDFYASEIVQVKPPALFNGRVVLVGDAGYAPGPTGMGTSLALAGAYVLAGEIANHPGDLDEGLAAYSDRMRPLVERAQEIPRGVPAVMAPYTAWGLWLRNAVFAVVTRTGFAGFMQMFGAWAFEKNENDNGLPEYDFGKHE